MISIKLDLDDHALRIELIEDGFVTSSDAISLDRLAYALEPILSAIQPDKSPQVSNIEET